MSENSAPTAGAAQPQLDGRAYLRLVGIGAVIGIPAALAALVFLGLVHVLEAWLWTDLPEALGLSSPAWWMIVGFPVVGALLVWAARALLPGDGGHEPLHGISFEPTLVSYVPSVALAALGSLAFGIVLGPEAPLIALGSAVGMVAVRWWKVTGPAQQVLSTAGVFSAVSALFGGPVVAGVLLLEGGITFGAQLIPVLVPGVVAAAIGYVIVVGVGSWGGIAGETLVVPDLPAYPNTRIVDLVLAVVVGAVVAVLVAIIRRVAVGVVGLRPRLGMGPSLVLGAVVIGLLTLLVDSAGGVYNDVLFSGQTTLPLLLSTSSEGLLALVILAKGLAYAVSLGAGFRGGPVFPAVFLGTAVALVIGLPFHMTTTAALAIGAACGMTAMTRLIFTSVVFVLLFEGTAGTAAVPAAVLAAVTAWLIGKAIESRTADAAAGSAGTAPGAASA